MSSERFRRIETNFEKFGGGAIVFLAALSGEWPAAALGAAIAFIGFWRTPEAKGGKA